MEINLIKYRGAKGTAFTGRPQGEYVRKKIGLDEFDKKEGKVKVIIPDETTAFNPSFFLGLFFESIEKLGSVEKFENKYILSNQIVDPEFKELVNEDIEDGKRHARNELKDKGGLKIFM